LLNNFLYFWFWNRSSSSLILFLYIFLLLCNKWYYFQLFIIKLRCFRFTNYILCLLFLFLLSRLFLDELLNIFILNWFHIYSLSCYMELFYKCLFNLLFHLFLNKCLQFRISTNYFLDVFFYWKLFIDFIVLELLFLILHLETYLLFMHISWELVDAIIITLSLWCLINI